MFTWIQSNKTLFWWLTGLSVFGFLASLVVIPIIVARIPTDYFCSEKRRGTHWSHRHPAIWLLIAIVKNLLGGCLVLLGVVMLFIPGQGLLTILIGLMLLNFPGKYRLERWLIGKPAILQAVNWLRRRSGQPPLVVDDLP